MKKKILALTLLAGLSTQLALAAPFPSFDSPNKPLSPHMASYGEMKRYEADLNEYLRKADVEIERLLEKKRRAIETYNKAVYEFNSDTFFHKEKMKPRKEIGTPYDDWFTNDQTIVIINNQSKAPEPKEKEPTTLEEHMNKAISDMFKDFHS